MAKTWHTDLRHLEAGAGPMPLAAKRRARFTGAIVEAATARGGDDPRVTAVRCIADVDGRTCGDWIHVVRDGDTIAWSCPGCADNGFVTHFDKSLYDLSRHRPPAGVERRVWALDEAQHKLLASDDDAPRPIVAALARAHPVAPDAEATLAVLATVDELDAAYAHVRALMDLAPGGPRDEALEEILAGIDLALA